MLLITGTDIYPSKEIVEMLESSSVALVKIGDKNEILGMASGCLIDFQGSRILLTVAHAVNEEPPMRLEIAWDEQEGQTKTCKLDPIIPFELTLKPELQNLKMNGLDFAYQKLSTNQIPLFQKLNPNGNGKILSSRPRKVYCESAIQSPKVDTLYGFAGRTQPVREKFPGFTILSSTLRVCYGLTFVGEIYGMHVFQLPSKSPGHDFFRGCSGAPIVDIEGNVVALVCRGCVEESLIYGFPIERYKVLLEIEVLGLAEKKDKYAANIATGAWRTLHFVQ